MAWNQEVSGADHRAMVADDIQVFNMASYHLNYIGMIHELYVHFATKIVERAQQSQQAAKLQQMEAESIFGKKVVNEICKMTLSQCRLIAEQPQSLQDCSSINKFWSDLFKTTPPSHVVRTVSDIVSKIGLKACPWSIEVCTQIRDCLHSRLERLTAKKEIPTAKRSRKA